jgi:hypothetical protein
MARAARAAGPAGRRSRGGPGRAPPPRGARTGPGHCLPRPATATRPGVRRAGPSPPATPSCRNRPERRPGPALAPGPHRGVPSAADAAPGPAAARASAAWSPAGHHAPGPPPATQPSLTCTLRASVILRITAGRTCRQSACRFPGVRSSHSVPWPICFPPFPRRPRPQTNRRAAAPLVPAGTENSIPPGRHLRVTPRPEPGP